MDLGPGDARVWQEAEGTADRKVQVCTGERQAIDGETRHTGLHPRIILRGFATQPSEEQWEHDRRPINLGSVGQSRRRQSSPGNGGRTSARPSRSHSQRAAGRSLRTSKAGAVDSPAFPITPARKLPSKSLGSHTLHASRPASCASPYLTPPQLFLCDPAEPKARTNALPRAMPNPTPIAMPTPTL